MKSRRFVHMAILFQFLTLKKICTVFCAYGVIEKSFLQWITLVYILTCTGDPAAGIQF